MWTGAELVGGCFPSRGVQIFAWDLHGINDKALAESHEAIRLSVLSWSESCSWLQMDFRRCHILLPLVSFLFFSF